MRRFEQQHPIEGDMIELVGGLLRRLQIERLARRFPSVPVLAAFSFVNGCASIGLMALTALVTGAPFVFPSLGPTAFLFYHSPRLPTASPRNTIIGQAIGAASGYFSLRIFGLADAGPAVTSDMTWSRVFAAALSLGLTSGLMVLLHASHPPAGATTLIISLGVLHDPWQIGVLMLAVVMLTLQALIINRTAGIPYPLWNPLPPASPPPAALPRRE